MHFMVICPLGPCSMIYYVMKVDIKVISIKSVISSTGSGNRLVGGVCQGFNLPPPNGLKMM